MCAAHDVDVIQMSDFRLPGGTTSSIAEEVRAQSAAGLSTALVHVAGAVTNYPLGWSSHIRKVLELPGVQLHTPHALLKANVLVIRHPTVLYSTRISLQSIQADHVVIVANHAAIDAAGTQHYDIAATDTKARELFGKAPIWAPIGPVVRGTMLQQTQSIPLRETDWFNIFDFPDSSRERTGFVEDRPVIGRHSRPQRGKWPDTSNDILAAYPESPQYQVRILGGAQIVQKLVGRVPENWEVIPFGGEDPAEFLKRIDFWVYMHHPDLKEAFGRAAMESLAAGCVAIMPPYMEELFGDAALYGSPHQVLELIDNYSDKEKFLVRSRRAQDFARQFSSQMHIDRLADLGVNSTKPVISSDENERLRPYREDSPAGPALLIVCGEQTKRTLSACSSAQTAIQDLVWVTISDAAQDLPASLFISSARRMNMSDDLWNEYFTSRITELISRTRPSRVIYSGVLPPRALLDSIRGIPVQKVWIQQQSDSVLREETIKATLDFHTVLTDEASNDELQAALCGGFN